MESASGSVGTFAVQIARAFGVEVTGVCSEASFGLVRSLGARRVFERSREEFVAEGSSYDVVFDAVGALGAEARRALARAPVFLDVHTASDAIRAAEAPRLLRALKTLVEEGKVKAVLDRTYGWEQMAQAHRYVDQGHKKGSVAVTVGA
ncbi:MAG: zinc-binding dehydrogenase [Myxococcales bacterium]